MSDTVGAFGLSFIKLTKFENQQAVLDTQTKRAAHMKNLATAAIKASRLYRELNSSTVKHLVNYYPTFFWFCFVEMLVLGLSVIICL